MNSKKKKGTVFGWISEARQQEIGEGCVGHAAAMSDNTECCLIGIHSPVLRLRSGCVNS